MRGMTQQTAATSRLTGRLGLVFLAACLGAAVYFGTDLFRHQASPTPATPVYHSNVLGMDVPGAEALAADEQIVGMGLDMARAAGYACTTSYEAFYLADHLTALDAINREMQAAGYDRINIESSRDGAIFKTTHPKSLLGITAGNGFFICEY